ncbi:MAG TPA: nucleoside kinase [Candidatus Binatia bacterium]|nr:nucleoside kinase [Candidatus Binatia bacterium]
MDDMSKEFTDPTSQIKPAPVRQVVQARFPDGRAFDGPINTTIEAFILAADLEVDGAIVAAVVNGRLRELSQPLTADADIVPVSTADSDGVRIYRRSLSFLLIAAAAELFPRRHINIDHSMPFGGYYCEVPNGQALTGEDLNCLRDRMRALVEADLPIKQVKVPLDEALELFQENNDLEKADLFARRRKDYLTLYELNEVRDYFHGFMVPSTGYLDLFDLRPYHEGFILQFPRRHQPDRLQPFEDEPRLARIFQEYNKWLDVIGVPHVSALNWAINSGRIQEVILVAEALHERQLAMIASEIASRGGEIKIILISGPTSAGKTTLSKRLAVQLLAQGVQPVAVNLDNYFVNREDTPRDEQGEYDFEALEAVDLPLFQAHLRSLLAGETIVQPVYNFHKGTRVWGDSLMLDAQHVLIVEGIHALNPRLTSGIPREAMYRIFISAFTQINLDRHNRVPTTDTRMLRRIVRDAANRGYNAAATIRRWPSVRRGEKKHIFPYQNNADIFFNSALVYELSMLKPLAQPLLLQVEPGTPERIEANRLLAFLQWFDPVPPEISVPSDSILREFIGDSILNKFEPWRR